jgi:hypothetical protein
MIKNIKFSPVLCLTFTRCSGSLINTVAINFLIVVVVYFMMLPVPHSVLYQIVEWQTNDESGRMLKKVVVTYFKVLSLHLSGGTEESHKRLRIVHASVRVKLGAPEQSTGALQPEPLCLVKGFFTVWQFAPMITISKHDGTHKKDRKPDLRHFSKDFSCRTWGPHSGDHEECCLLRYNAA